MEEISEKIFALDIGGSHIKATILNSKGDFLQDYEKEATPIPCTPEKLLAVVKDLAKKFSGFDKIAAGFPGYVKKGITKTAPLLGNDFWKDYDLTKSLEQIFGKPALVINDADLQGIALSSGKGFELALTLGTGLGNALMYDGVLLPHLEMSQHPFTKKKNYNDYIGEAALQKIGKERWNKRIEKVIVVLKTVFNYDHLYISGGNARLLNIKLDSNITITDNKDGIKGAAVLWKQKSKPTDKNEIISVGIH